MAAKTVKDAKDKSAAAKKAAAKATAAKSRAKRCRTESPQAATPKAKAAGAKRKAMPKSKDHRESNPFQGPGSRDEDQAVLSQFFVTTKKEEANQGSLPAGDALPVSVQEFSTEIDAETPKGTGPTPSDKLNVEAAAVGDAMLASAAPSAVDTLSDETAAGRIAVEGADPAPPSGENVIAEPAELTSLDGPAPMDVEAGVGAVGQPLLEPAPTAPTDGGKVETMDVGMACDPAKTSGENLTLQAVPETGPAEPPSVDGGGTLAMGEKAGGEVPQQVLESTTGVHGAKGQDLQPTPCEGAGLLPSHRHEGEQQARLPQSARGNAIYCLGLFFSLAFCVQ